ncbi:MAG: LysM peptidoglycan-binding domain-containing protein, partial [Planctomycetaceae bacterium]|nr:LysM peptidoglycan-binding domain-containing protein [Planctomycetaceae bacterium]
GESPESDSSPRGTTSRETDFLEEGDRLPAESSALKQLDELSGFDDDLLGGSTSYRSQSASGTTASEKTASGKTVAGRESVSDDTPPSPAERSDSSFGGDNRPFGSEEEADEMEQPGPIAAAESEEKSTASPAARAEQMIARTEENATSRKVEAKSVSVQSGSPEPPSRRTPENPYGLYLIEPVDTADEDSEPEPAAARAAQSPAVSESAVLKQKFVPARSPLANRRPAAPVDTTRTAPVNPPAGRATSNPAEPGSALRPGTWVIRRGDTLEGIAVKVYGRRSAATTIFEANRDQLRNPNLLRPGMELRLPVPAR